jgi:hypothetical protein
LGRVPDGQFRFLGLIGLPARLPDRDSKAPLKVASISSSPQHPDDYICKDHCSHDCNTGTEVKMSYVKGVTPSEEKKPAESDERGGREH